MRNMKVWIPVWVALLLLPLYNPYIAVILSLIASVVAYLIYLGFSYSSPYKRMAWSSLPDYTEVRTARMEVEEDVKKLTPLERAEDVLVPSITFLVFLVDFIWAAAVT